MKEENRFDKIAKKYVKFIDNVIFNRDGAFCIGILAFVILFALLALGMHIAFAMALVAFAGMMVLGGFEAAMGMLSTAPHSIVADYYKSA